MTMGGYDEATEQARLRAAGYEAMIHRRTKDTP